MQNPTHLLKEEFEKRKARNPHFSLRAFAKWLDISPAQLSQMMAGKRPLTVRSLKKIGDRLGLSPLEKNAWASGLVANSSADLSSPAQKKMLLQEDQFRLIADWYHFAILSLTKIKGSQADPRWVARRLGISVEEAHQAILRLERMGILQTKPVFKQIVDPLEIVSDVPSDAIRKYHKQNLALAAEKIETVSMKLREYQSISMILNPSQVVMIKKQVDAFLTQISASFENENGTEVYNLNVQLYPVSKPKEKNT